MNYSGTEIKCVNDEVKKYSRICVGVDMYLCMLENDQIYVEENVAWFVERYTNDIFSMDMSNGLCKRVAMFPKKKESLYRCNPILVKYKNSLILIPDKGDSFFKYDLEKNFFHEIKMPDEEGKGLGIYYHWEMGHDLYLLASGINSILKLNMENMQVDKLAVIKETVSCAVMVDQWIYVALQKSNLILEYCIVDGEERHYEIPQVNNIGTICFDGSLFWFSGNEYKIYSWKKESNEVKIYDNFPEDFVIYSNFESCKKQYDKYEIMPINIFDVSVCVNDKIFFLPLNNLKVCCNCMLYMDVTNNQMGSIILSKNQRKGGDIVEYILGEELVAIFSQENNYISEIDVKTLSIKKRFMYVEREIFLERQRTGHCIIERMSRNIIDIAKVIDIAKDDVLADESNIHSRNVGMQIYKKCVEAD